MHSPASLGGLAVTDRVGVHHLFQPPTIANVRAAINASPTIGASSHFDIPRSDVATLGAKLLEGMYDDYPVEYNVTHTPPAANVLEVADIEQMHALLRTFYHVAASIQYDSTESRHERTLRLIHVREHAEAAKMLGAKGVSFGIKLAWHVGPSGVKLVYQMYARPVNLHTTKLGLATIAAAPERLSESDILDIRAMGYSGVTDVADRIARHNRMGPPIFPTPGSIRVPIAGPSNRPATELVR